MAIFNFDGLHLGKRAERFKIPSVPMMLFVLPTAASSTSPLTRCTLSPPVIIRRELALGTVVVSFQYMALGLSSLYA